MKFQLVIQFFIICIFCAINIFGLPSNYNNIQHRFTRDTKDSNITNVEAKKDDNVAKNETTKRKTIIDDIQSILEDSSKILRSLIEIKTRVLTPLVDGIGKTLDIMNKSEALNRTMEVVSTVGEAGIKASTGIAAAVTRTGNSASPSITKVVDKAANIGDRLVRLGICGVVCPLQNDQERKDCFKKNCGKDGGNSKTNKNKSENKEEPVDEV